MKNKTVKGWACVNNERLLRAFVSIRDARSFAFYGDEIVPCTITYSLATLPKRKKPITKSTQRI